MLMIAWLISYVILISKSNEFPIEEKLLRYAIKTNIRQFTTFIFIESVIFWFDARFLLVCMYVVTLPKIDIMALQIKTNQMITKMTRHLNSIWSRHTPAYTLLFHSNQRYSVFFSYTRFLHFFRFVSDCVIFFRVYVLFFFRYHFNIVKLQIPLSLRLQKQYYTLVSFFFLLIRRNEKKSRNANDVLIDLVRNISSAYFMLLWHSKNRRAYFLTRVCFFAIILYAYFRMIGSLFKRCHEFMFSHTHTHAH